MMIKNINFSNKLIVVSSLLFAVQTANAIEPHEGAAAVLNAPDELRNIATSVSLKISDQVSSVFVPAGGVTASTVQYNSNAITGLAAGENTPFPYRPSVWGNFSYSNIENDHNVIKSDTDVNIFMIGIDTKVAENFLIGAVISYEDSDSTTKPLVTAFDPAIGASSLKSDVDKSGVSFTFYGGYKFTDTMNMDVSVGFASDIDIDQKTSAISPFGDSLYKASSSNKRETVAINLNKFWLSDSYVIEGHVGYLYTKETQEDYLVTDLLNPGFQFTQDLEDITLGQLNLRGRFTMLLGNFEPYAGLTIEHDINSADENYDGANLFIGAADELETDDTGYVFSLGFDYYIQDNGSLNFEVSTVESRDDVDNLTAQIGYRYNF